MLVEQALDLRETFRAKAEIDRRDLRFFLDTERTFEAQKIEARRDKDLHEKLEAWERATNQDIAVFRDHLDHYDTAVVEALTDNEEALNKVRQQREKIEASAYRLPDGRMVFKTEEGKRVVDQYEKDVPPGVLAADSIPNSAPRWQEFKTMVSEEHRLEKERDDLHHYQQKLDDARDTVNKGDVSKKELDTLDADLQASMPDAAKRHMAPSGQSRDAGVPQPDGPARAPLGADAPRYRPDPSAFGPR